MTDFEIYLKTYYLIILLGNMPSKPIDYSKTHIYKIVCKDTNIKDCYVGHTTDFSKRKSQHKRMTTNEQNRHYNIYLYHFIRENGGWDNWDMINIETINCKDSLEAKTIERDFTEKLGANLNRVQAIETQEEKAVRKKQWAEDNAERVKENNRQYYLDHKEEHNAYGKQYREEHKDEIREWKKQHYEENEEDILAKQKERYEEKKDIILERNKQWRNEHKEEQKKYWKQFRVKNKDKIQAWKTTKINCECGSVIRQDHKAGHIKSKKHQAYLKQQEDATQSPRELRDN